MPNQYVVYGCNNTHNIRAGIALHKIPFWADKRPEAKKRKRWVNFVHGKCANGQQNKGPLFVRGIFEVKTSHSFSTYFMDRVDQPSRGKSG